MSDSGVKGESESWIVNGLTADSPSEEQEIISLRPLSFKEYIGQQKVKENLQIAAGAAKKREEALDHVLLYGPPGLGKTSLAKILANELNVDFKATSGPVIERPGDLAAMLTSLTPHSILFIDEIHRLLKVVQEVLYSAMEDYEIDILIGQGPAAKSVKVPLKPFTLVGATTHSGTLSSPLRDRFGIVSRLDYYSPAELQKIVVRSAEILEIDIDQDSALELARRSRGTPRVCNKILKRVRDYAQTKGDGKINQEIVQKSMQMLDIDHAGLTASDRSILRILIEKFSGGPVGIDTLATALSEDKATIEFMYEPYLIQNGFLARTARGRVVTELAYEHLGIAMSAANSSKSDQPNLKLF